MQCECHVSLFSFNLIKNDGLIIYISFNLSKNIGITFIKRINFNKNISITFFITNNIFGLNLERDNIGSFCKKIRIN